MSPVPGPSSVDQRWVLAVDVRPGPAARLTATADAAGVRPGPELAGALHLHGRVAPLAVVVVHPGPGTTTAPRGPPTRWAPRSGSNWGTTRPSGPGPCR